MKTVASRPPEFLKRSLGGLLGLEALVANLESSEDGFVRLQNRVK